MWPFRKKQSSKKIIEAAPQPPKPAPVAYVPTACAATCTCAFSQLFKYRELPELVGTRLTLSSMVSIPDDVKTQFGKSLQLGKFIDWTQDEGLPGYAGELWKHRRAELCFELSETTQCEVAGEAMVKKLGLGIDDIFTHEEFLAEMAQRAERLVLKVMLKDRYGIAYRGNGGFCCEGQAMLLVSKEEEDRYKQALANYKKEAGKQSADLTFEDGVLCFLGEYLPHEFVVADACITNMSRVWSYKHFAL